MSESQYVGPSGLRVVGYEHKQDNYSIGKLQAEALT